MISSIQQIRAQAELDKQRKIVEVKGAKERYMQLMNSISGYSCQCQYDDRYYRYKICYRCSMVQQAQSIEVSFYECPLPSDQNNALAVIFELQMPIEIRNYRDILWQFNNRPTPHPSHKMNEWLHCSPHAHKLGPFYTGPQNCKVKLISPTKSITETLHWSPSIAYASERDFLYENSLGVGISSSQPTESGVERCILTPQLTHADYKQLQFTIDTTKDGFSVHCGRKCSNIDYTLNITIGPLTADSETTSNPWCPESHQQLLEDHFVDEFISRLNRRLDDCELNWQNELVLIVITMITMRIFTLCNSTKEIEGAELALKCRRIGEKWIDLICTSIQTVPSSCFAEVEKLRFKMVTIGFTCLLTFSTHQGRIKYLLSSHNDVQSLLKAATTVHDNSILNKNQAMMSIFLRNMMRFSERVLVMLQSTLAEFLQNTSYQSLNEFATSYWAVIRSKGTMDEKWRKRREDPHDGWYDSQYGSRHIFIDCIRGTFLVDGMTVGFLPENMTSSEFLVRVFDQYIFEVQAAQLPNTYITKNSYHNERVFYEFVFDYPTQRFIITERHIQTSDVFQLIPHSCFQKELADTFVSNHSHWLNLKDRTLQFRPVQFQNSKFLDDIPYMLTLDAGLITTTDTKNIQTLINKSSTFFQKLFSRYFSRLDEKPYVYMMRENTSQCKTIIYIYLSRLRIAFIYNNKTRKFTSREYSDMCIAENQWFGTLTGLTFGLLLTPSSVHHDTLEQYSYRKLIVPFGYVDAAKTSYSNQHIVMIRRSLTPFSDQYFLFILNDRLGILQSTASPTGWLYLALLHAITSHPLPDQYTGVTGMELAFQLLNSAGCWSDQPLDGLSLNILQQIAALSPKVDYYPADGACMEKIDWNDHGLPYFMQNFGYYLIARRIIDASEQFNSMYPSLISKTKGELFNGKLYNEALLNKLYWNYRDSYNPSARLSVEMETEILSTISKTPYRSAPEYGSHVTNYSEIHLLDNLYRSGDVNLRDCSKQHWLPLFQWLTKENQLKNVWIGLLKKAISLGTEGAGNSTDDMHRFAILLDFLHYISGTCRIKPFHLQMLKTVCKVSTLSWKTIIFPPFMYYYDIEDVSFTKERINLLNNYTTREREQIIEEVRRCWRNNLQYQNINRQATSTEQDHINHLLKSWRSNEKLRSFLQVVQSLICSIPIEQFDIKVSYHPQQFACEIPHDHHQIQYKSTNHFIDAILLQKAEEKFHQTYSGHFNKPKLVSQGIDQAKEFPYEIFSSLNEQENTLSAITNYFKNQLAENWRKLLSNEQTQKEDPSIEELIELLNSFREESTKFWNELIKSITSSNEQLFETGLATRMAPTPVITLFQQDKAHTNFFLASLVLTKEQRTLLGGTIVNWALEQQLERALSFAIHQKWEDFRKEISHTPHSNWIPCEHIPWLILELEMNVTIRETQINVARHMIQPNLTTDDSTTQSIVMQLNMGEGKTSVILPMLAVSSCSSPSSLIRIVVLKSLFPTNHQSLRYKLGGLLNRRIFPFACRRDMNFNHKQINRIFARFRQGLQNYDVILTSPEDILSFDLLTIDKCRQNDFDIGRAMLRTQLWLKRYARDVLDESDDILHVKYQLIYTVGGQQQVDAGAERWKTIQSILELVKKYAADISKLFAEHVCYRPSKLKSVFPQFHLQSDEPFPVLCEKIVNDWLNQRSYRQVDKQIIWSFILETKFSVDDLQKKFPQNDIQLFLIVRGLLSSGVLFVALKKRYRVNYGVNPNPSFNRLIAVPFRAKDVAADRTEFGHPDIALVLTHLTYYYSGLKDSQMIQCFNRLIEAESDPASIYDQWIFYENRDDIPTNIQQWRGVNLKDYEQTYCYLFPTFRHNMLVINYFLNYFIFPREAKQFPHKLVSSAWDIASSLRTKVITGFSGTNDTQLLLPVYIRQLDLPELQNTDAIVVNNLLKSENESYQSLPIDTTSENILQEIIQYRPSIQVILDVGALFIDGTNQEIAMKWLNLSDKAKIDYAVYFDSDSISACDRQSHHHLFATSPANERLDRCVFYLDEIHTRGTDFKFPHGFHAALTLGNGLTKDRCVQAAMRMRKLGSGHSLTFWSSYEVHQQIIRLKKQSFHVNVTDILHWVYENTQQTTWDGLHHWAAKSLSFQRKLAAFRHIQWNNDQQSFTDRLMENLARECLEPEVIDLIQMYGASKVSQTLFEIHSARYQRTDYQISIDIQEAVLKRLREYGGTKQRLSQLLEEEQQRELEQELEEERQLARPPSVKPCVPVLHDDIKRLCDTNNDMMNLAQLPDVFRPLAYAFNGTTIDTTCQCNSWQSNMWISTEFQRVIATKGESLNPFLRPPRWIIIYRNQHLIFLSALEANWLLGRLNSVYQQQPFNSEWITTLRLLLPRTKRIQSIFANNRALTIPPAIRLRTDVPFPLALEWLAQLFIFNGTVYFETIEEQTVYCQCLGLCPKPRTLQEEEAFEQGWIAADGFVSEPEYRRLLQIHGARFDFDPLTFVKQVIENRTNVHATISSHVGSIILNSCKLL
ncbi:unnamed protein product [Didymodactylos carnosus]|uniref:ubiquitinyl hydrolase 1 n=1 Tax=Didymodactylos carnosus TaxID=1234261 RepID=A0A814GIY8_9BILA|nr:unnamed protein product [Didymodactylos carnosus]CAF0997103.1 unnamed protein product [Didymodactylos carnosus]CAF3695377.1 unnamed protein product [Didymodactylos carnosus]CAF3768653.1 unnamed protein product [Didymodactylos carnosus]